MQCLRESSEVWGREELGGEFEETKWIHAASLDRDRRSRILSVNPLAKDVPLSPVNAA